MKYPLILNWLVKQCLRFFFSERKHPFFVPLTIKISLLCMNLTLLDVSCQNLSLKFLFSQCGLHTWLIRCTVPLNSKLPPSHETRFLYCTLLHILIDKISTFMSLKLMSSVEGLAGYSTSDVTSRSAVMPNASRSQNMTHSATVDLHSVQTSTYQSSSVIVPLPTTSRPPGK